MTLTFNGKPIIFDDELAPKEKLQLTTVTTATPHTRPSTRPRRRPSRSLGTPDPARLGRYPDAIPVEVDVDKISRIQSAIQSKLYLYSDADRKLLTKHCNNLHTLISERIDGESEEVEENDEHDEENDDE